MHIHGNASFCHSCKAILKLANYSIQSGKLKQICSEWKKQLNNLMISKGVLPPENKGCATGKNEVLAPLTLLPTSFSLGAVERKRKLDFYANASPFEQP